MSRRLPLSAVLAAVAVVVIVVVAMLLQAGPSQDGPGTSPEVSSPGSSSTPTSPAKGNLVPASSRTPASGVCGRAAGAVVTVRIEPDTPEPVCAAVSDDQSLRVVNSTGDFGAPARTVTVRWLPGQPFRLGPGRSKTFPQHFGTYLATGVHDLDVTSISGYRAQIWLR